MLGLDNDKPASTAEQRLSFLTYFLAGSGLLATLMFFGATLYISTM